jgi:hypothetical protein
MANEKKGATWGEVYQPRQWDTGALERPTEDPLKQGDSIKRIGYPTGLHSLPRKDIWLNNIKSGDHVFTFTFGPGLQQVGPLQIEPHGEHRGLYLDYIYVNTILVPGGNLAVGITIEWQIWSDFHRVANGTHLGSEQRLDLYFPPFSNESFYMRLRNLTAGPPVFLDINVSLRYVVFDINSYPYKLGKGTGAQNPAWVDVTWPGFAGQILP